jgi:hypothetical protein
MAKYATATVDMRDGAGWGATTALRTRSGGTAFAATTTPTRTKEVSIWIKGGVQLPKWFEVAREALNEVSALPANWNSYAAREIQVGAVTGAVELLLAVMDERKPLPTFVPVPNGGVLLEWHTAAGDLEVTVLPAGRMHVVFEKAGVQPVEAEGLPQELMGRVRAYLEQI